MKRNWIAVVAVGLIVTCVAYPVSAQPSSLNTTDPRVTSDTPAYCGKLLSRINTLERHAARPLSGEAAALSEEGQRMCGQGQIRGGIMRLRRAIVIMRQIEE